MTATKRIRERLQEIKQRPAQLPLLEIERKRQFEQSLDVLNMLLNSPARPQAITELRKTLHQRARKK